MAQRSDQRSGPTPGMFFRGETAATSGILRIEDLTKRYGTRTALDAISLNIPENEYITVLGPSGSGKTSLLRVIAGFEQPEEGSIRIAGTAVDHVPVHRREIGFVFQNFALFPHLTVYENVAYGLRNRAVEPVADRAKLRSKVRAMLDLVGLTGLEDRSVHQISGGQRQRVALARTLVTEPRLVLLDEPLGALDANLRARMRGELRRIRAQLGVSFLHVTGSETEALAMGDRLIVLDEGRIAQFDRPLAVYNTPASARVARFLNCYNLFTGKIGDADFRSDNGIFPIARLSAAADHPTYAIRQDLITVTPADQTGSPGHAEVEAKFVASEYSGAAMMYFFKLRDGQVIEVENHFSHRSPQEFEPHHPYRLTWRAEDAIVFG